jgi:uncharacterized protein YndB with AHSA1/START domain
MATGTRHGYLILADISGYTAYLTGTELEHAQDILSKLIQTILDACRPPMELVELEGDAVYVYLPDTAARGEAVVEALEGAYFGFAGRRDTIAHVTACTCQACRAIPTLDLKFVVHFGAFVFQELAGRSKPIGPDVILAHRLLKNQVAEETGSHAYILFTDSALQKLGLDATALGLRPHVETYEHLGEVPGAVQDLASRWETERATRRVRIAPTTARVQHAVEVAAPPAVVWEYLTAPAQRLRWEPELCAVSPAAEGGGQIGVGTELACDHGDGARSEIVLDWRPAEYFTIRKTVDAPLQPRVVVTTELAPTAEGTRVTWYSAPETGWKAGLGFALGRGRLQSSQQVGGQRLRQLVADEYRPAGDVGASAGAGRNPPA